MSAATVREKAVSLRQAARAELARHFDGDRYRGELSSSALATATASMTFAMAAHAAEAQGGSADDLRRLARAGHDWLRDHQNDDGGFGDTTDSPSNISTSCLVWATWAYSDGDQANGDALARLENHVESVCGGTKPDQIATTVRARYGKDHTFSVPILVTCAHANRLGTGRDGWRLIPPLPYELAAFPRGLFRFFRMPTVSYALPALIAMGQVIQHHRPSRNPFASVMRWATRSRTIRVLRDIQPKSGGYLEATPLTSFVAMSLISMGLENHDVVRDGLDFLERSMRPDGSWPIDTNLDTWTTTLAVNAMGSGAAESERSDSVREWLCGQQYLQRHLYTGADPGGFAWTDLPGGVPDADDTAGALLALDHLGPRASSIGHDGDLGSTDRHSAGAALGWLCGLQNKDGGIPTFCRGWGTLPFDRSSPDLTAHALRAFSRWRHVTTSDIDAEEMETAARRAMDYLIDAQRDDGTWVPLWFGNQFTAAEENPTYGTSRVLRAIADVEFESNRESAWLAAGEKAVSWLVHQQGTDGGFGGDAAAPASVEETAVALEALAVWMSRHPETDLLPPIRRAVTWLDETTAGGTRWPSAPIGLYFAKLWYSEKLYPIVMSAAALEVAAPILEAN